MATSHTAMPKLTGVIRPIIRVPITYMRDRIVVDAAFEKEIRDELAFRKTAPGTKTGLETPLYVVARHIVHASKYDLKLTGRPLVLVGDHYDGNGGSIDTTDYASQAGTGEAGGVGGNGKPGASGKAAPGITLVAQRVTDARLVATGRPGGRGGAGGEGPKGANAIWDTGSKGGGPVVKPHCVSDGKDGGIGGNGGPGGKGGAGGAIASTSARTASSRSMARAAPVGRVVPRALPGKGAPRPESACLASLENPGRKDRMARLATRARWWRPH